MTEEETWAVWLEFGREVDHQVMMTPSQIKALLWQLAMERPQGLLHMQDRLVALNQITAVRLGGATQLLDAMRIFVLEVAR